jgi:molybdate transport system substrate-binding protein
MLLALEGMAAAAEVRVLATRATEGALATLAKEFAQETGHRAVFTIGSPAAVMAKIKANEIYDVVVLAEPAIDQLDKQGLANPESRVRLANIGLGLAVREGAPVPDIATADGFKQALTNAKSIVYGEVFPNTSGERIEKMLASMGLLDTLKPKLKIVPGHANSQALIAKGEIELGLYNMSEIPDGKGVKYVGPVPAPFQSTATFEAARMSEGSAVEASEAFIRYIGGAEGRPAWAKARFIPLADH